jgi:DNA replication protein
VKSLTLKDKNKQLQQLQQGILIGIHEGSVSIPHVLLKYYRKLHITEVEVMLLIHLIAFKEKENKDFPTIEEIAGRMSASAEAVIQAIQKLMKRELITIDEDTEPQTGIQYERYNWLPLLEQLAFCCIEELKANQELLQPELKKQGKDMFSIFENEFARPLSPMECEMITNWLDKDQYAEELILAALKEAVFAGKVHFRYIDRILLEWSRNRVFTVEQAREHANKFRGAR